MEALPIYAEILLSWWKTGLGVMLVCMLLGLLYAAVKGRDVS